jgi:hypothetical protein
MLVSSMSDILLIKQQGSAFSKKQEQFNKLILSLGKRKKQLLLLETRFRGFIERRQRELDKPVKNLSAGMLLLVQLLDRHYESGALKKIEKNKTVQLILNICSSIENPENCEEHKRLLTKYLQLESQGFNKKGKAAQKDLLKEMFSAAFGADPEEELDLDDLGDLKEKLNQQFTEDKHQRQKERFSGNKHKAYTGVNKKLAEKAALLQKSWKSLYLKLVKKFHPDTEKDEEKKLHKTVVMQQVTMAYEKNDFYTLLAIYQQQIGFDKKESEQDDKLFADNALYQYIIILKQQDAELKDKIGNIEFEGANHGMPYLANKDAEQYFINSLKRQKAEIRNNIISVNEDTVHFRNIDQYRAYLKNMNLQPAADFDFSLDDY